MPNHGKGGRPPDPTVLKLVKGVTRKERVNYDDPSLQLPKLDPDAIEMPATITRHHAVAQWNYYAPRLAKMGVLTDWDVSALEAMVQAYADMIELRAVIEEEGRFFYGYLKVGDSFKFDEDGKPIVTDAKSHPSVRQYAEADRRFKGYLTELGLTPSSRSRVKVTPPEGKVDPAERHFG